MTISEALLADFDAEAAHTRKLLDAVPDGRFDWKPHEKSMTLGGLAGHIADTPNWTGGMMADVFDLATGMDEWAPFEPETRAELMEAFEKNLNVFREAVAGKDDGFLSATWEMRMGDQVLMSCPRHAALRSTLIHHVAHHRGQLTVYLRLLDVPVPGTYGPTADEQMFA